MNDAVLAALHTFSKVQLIEAYTGKPLSIEPPSAYELDRIAEVRFRANEMPTIYYETDNSRKTIKN